MSSVNVLSSAIDVESIVQNLMYIEEAPIRRMESETTTLESKVSAFQSLNSKLSSLEDKVKTILYGSGTVPLQAPYSFSDRLATSIFSVCKVSSSNEDAISAVTTDVSADGSYTISVSNLARAKSSASVNFEDMTSVETGTGTLTITTGAGDPVNITIDSNNNTLSGVRNAINAANAGVTATIIDDGSASPYRLLITADDTGTENAFTITDNLSGGQALGIVEMQAAEDAQFVVNGVAITKNTNTVSDVVDGVTLTLKQETASDVRIDLETDTDSIVDSIKELITAYNNVSSFINAQFRYNATTESSGVLSGDATLRSIQSNLQKQVLQSVQNQYSSFGVTSQIGLNFNRDGGLELDETKFREALADNFTDVAALLLGNGTPSGGATVTDNRVSYTGKTGATQAGTYAVEITSLAEQAVATGIQTITTLANDETLTITSGASNAVVNLLAGDDLTTVLSKINAALTTEGLDATAVDDGSGQIRISTDNYGSSYDISVVSNRDSSAGTTGFGTTPVTGNGADIEGTIGGNSAVGSGRTLTGAAGQPEEGLSLSISQTTTGSYGSVTLASDSEGVEGSSILLNLYSVLDGITDPLSGPIHHATDGLNQNIRLIEDRIEAYRVLLDTREALLYSQYQKADEALRLMNVTTTSLSSQIGSLTS
ncbi:MAG: flagellar filament capping protein FliD [Acidobacteria bacterium]|nr:flagellar filament capping protein FliD [Acidobacteriota bacterium]